MGSDPSSSHKALLVLLLSWDQHFPPSCFSSLSKIILQLKRNSPLRKFAKIHITIKLEGKTKPQIPSIPISPAQLQARANHCTFPFRDQFPVTWGQCHQPNTQREHVWSRALFKQSPLFGPASKVCLKKPFRSRRHLCANPALPPAWHCRLWLRWLCFHRTAAS